VNNTLTLVKTNSDSIFGGYSGAAWTLGSDVSAGDFHSFLFSIRRNGTEDIRIFKNGGTQDRSSNYNIYNYVINGPNFGYLGRDLNIVTYSNKYAISSSNLGYTYQLPEECTYNSDCAKSFLAGSYTGWLTTEIEVYQMIGPITTSVKPGMHFYYNNF
jgi:hypothetical protein